MDRFANLEALVAVVEAGSFSRAAERLGVAKSVVSRRVNLLEDALGAQLLQRTTRSLSLTGPGQRKTAAMFSPDRSRAFVVGRL